MKCRKICSFVKPQKLWFKGLRGWNDSHNIHPMVNSKTSRKRLWLARASNRSLGERELLCCVIDWTRQGTKHQKVVWVVRRWKAHELKINLRRKRPLNVSTCCNWPLRLCTLKTLIIARRKTFHSLADAILLRDNSFQATTLWYCFLTFLSSSPFSHKKKSSLETSLLTVAVYATQVFVSRTKSFRENRATRTDEKADARALGYFLFTHFSWVSHFLFPFFFWLFRAVEDSTGCLLDSLNLSGVASRQFSFLDCVFPSCMVTTSSRFFSRPNEARSIECSCDWKANASKCAKKTSTTFRRRQLEKIFSIFLLFFSFSQRRSINRTSSFVHPKGGCKKKSRPGEFFTNEYSKDNRDDYLSFFYEISRFKF